MSIRGTNFKQETMMKKNRLKKFSIGEEGISAIALIVAILLLGSIGYLMSSLMVRSQESVPRTLNSTRAFYIAQGGVEFVANYLRNLGGSAWTAATAPASQNLGTGSFTVTFTPVNATNLTATIIGTSGSANRQIIASYRRNLPGIIGQGGIVVENNATIDCNNGDPVCDNTNLATCACVSENFPAAIMTPIPVPSSPTPGELQFTDGSSKCNVTTNNYTGTILAGIYYCPAGMSFKNGANITLGGAVTIFTTGATLRQNAKLNNPPGGSAANLLIVGSGTTGTTFPITVENNAVLNGSIYAPGMIIDVVNNSVIFGSIAGGIAGDPDSLIIHNNADITYVAGAGSNTPFYTQTVAGVSIVRLTNWQE
jgi:hypothetical protein